MPKVKLTISIEEEIAKDLRNRSIEKYGNSRSFSQLIEDMAPLRFSRDEPSEGEVEAIIDEFAPRCTKEGGCEPPNAYHECGHCGAVFESLHSRIFSPKCCPYCGSDDIRDANVTDFSDRMTAEHAARRRWRSPRPPTPAEKTPHRADWRGSDPRP